MKRYLPILLSFCLMASFAVGCSDEGAATGGGVNTGGVDAAGSITEASSGAGPNSGGIDIDLSRLSGILTYSQVVNVYDAPADYVGKTIKLNGLYNASYIEDTDSYYHFIVVGDEALCCEIGMEFVWSGDHKYPDDYPEEYTEIEVVGVFESHEMRGNTYYRLRVDDILIMG